ncbi:hypothetical protein [Xanthovirga aplysinae]|uniref:hypothetical protein n=1 Tax=Xanthovirga aplysinae TaxID=2529853 RepID=UPI0012BBBAFD|nr:hypothetical protein [Xanthovirga aplysinae]MTI29428.1 hypothetical protein [Xanthovirga aplysinae]
MTGMHIKLSRILKCILFFYLMVPIGCGQENLRCSDSCCGETFEQEFTKIESLTVDVGKIKVDKNSSNEQNNFVYSKSDDFKFAAIKIAVIELENLSFSHMNKFNFSFIQSAYACSPPEPEPDQKLTSIRITSDKTIFRDSKTFNSGQDLSELFEVVEISNEFNRPIEDFIIDQNEHTFLFGSYESSLILKLNQQIHIPQNELSIEINFDDNSQYVLTTNNFKIKDTIRKTV